MTEAGQLNGIKVTYYGDCGNSPNDNSLPQMQTWADNGISIHSHFFCSFITPFFIGQSLCLYFLLFRF
jgi:hypothetical protein